MSKITVPLISRFCAFNFALLALISAWLWHQNQTVQMPEAPLAANEKIQCVSYSPYYKEGVTPLNINTKISPEQIDHDLAILSKQFACVRVYSVGQGLDHVPEAAKKLGMKVYLGAWIGWIKKRNEQELTLAISLANQYPETVKALIVGNEVLLRGEQSEASLKAYIERAKQSVQVPVTYADVWEFWRKHPSLEASVDFVTVHILPYWEDNPQPIDHALDHTKKVMDLIAHTFKKPILIGETGWPSAGRQREGAEPSLINQARYIRGFLMLADEQHWNYNLIEAFDQPWKRNLEGTAGGYWGMFKVDMTPKFSFSGNLAERDDASLAIYAGCLGALLFLAYSLLFKLGTTKHHISMALFGALVGVNVLLQAEYLAIACRTPQEWLALGGLALLGFVSLLSLPAFVFKGYPIAKKLLSISSTLFLLAALSLNYLLLVDGRYRDFAIALYALPALQLSLGLFIFKQSIKPTFSAYRWLGILLVVSAMVCLYKEPSNHLAMIWLVISTLIAWANWPAKRSTTI